MEIGIRERRQIPLDANLILQPDNWKAPSSNQVAKGFSYCPVPNPNTREAKASGTLTPRLNLVDQTGISSGADSLKPI